MQSVKLGGINYDFSGLWYDSTWDWTPVFRIIGENSAQSARSVEYSSCTPEKG